MPLAFNQSDVCSHLSDRSQEGDKLIWQSEFFQNFIWQLSRFLEGSEI